MTAAVTAAVTNRLQKPIPKEAAVATTAFHLVLIRISVVTSAVFCQRKTNDDEVPKNQAKGLKNLPRSPKTASPRTLSRHEDP